MSAYRLGDSGHRRLAASRNGALCQLTARGPCVEAIGRYSSLAWSLLITDAAVYGSAPAASALSIAEKHGERRRQVIAVPDVPKDEQGWSWQLDKDTGK